MIARDDHALRGPVTPTGRPAQRLPVLLSLAALAIIIAGLKLGREVLVPLSLAALLGFYLAPIADALERWKLGRIPSVIITVAITLSVLAAAGWLAYYQLSDLTSEMQERSASIEERIESLKTRLWAQNKKVEGVLAKVGQVIERPPPTAAPPSTGEPASTTTAKESVTSPLGLSSDQRPMIVRVVEGPANLLDRFHQAVGSIINPLATAGIVFVLLIFILLQRDDLRVRCIRVIGTESLSAPTQAINDAAERVSRYLIVQGTINGVYGVVIAAGLFFLGVPGWFLWGCLAGAMRFLPYIGLWVGAAPPILYLVLTTEGWARPLWGIGLFGTIDLIAYIVCEPWLVKRSTGVSPFAMLLAVFFWTWLWGPIGLILATPLTVCLVVWGKHIPHLRYLNILLGDREPLKPHEQVYQHLLSDGMAEAQGFVREWMATHGLCELYDSVIAPAVRLCEEERASGHLRDAAYHVVVDGLREIVDSLAKPEAAAPHLDESGSPSSRVIACLPAMGEADDLAALMLGQLCAEAGWNVHAVSPELLVGEMIDSLGPAGVDLACVVSLHVAGRRNARSIAKRLQSRYPSLLLVQLLWGANEPKGSTESLMGISHEYATSAAEALRKMEGLALPVLASDRESAAGPP